LSCLFLAKKVVPTLGLVMDLEPFKLQRTKLFKIVKLNNKMKPLSNLDIDKIMKNCGDDRGTFNKVMLPKAMDENELVAVMNLRDYFAGSGTHWVCIYNDEKSKKRKYFDSFGLIFTNQIVKYMKKHQQRHNLQ